MPRVYLCSGLLATVGLSLCGCASPRSSSERHSARMDEARDAATRVSLTQMADNAAMHDMSVADIHFIPHASKLSGTGVKRLDQLAAILHEHGGTVRYETYLTDAELIKHRLDQAREYLAMAGCDMERSDVQLMISGGRGMSAKDAIEIVGGETEEGGGEDAGSGGFADLLKGG